METGKWSSTILRTLVLIVGLVVVLETVQVLSISITVHALAQDIMDIRSFAGIATGLFVGSLSMIPSRKKQSSRSKRVGSGYWINRVTAFKRIDEFNRLENLVQQHTTIR